jgi:hypothetical protein
MLSLRAVPLERDELDRDRLDSSTTATITTGARHACAFDAMSATLRCWGDNSEGQLGDGSTAASTIPVSVLPFP